MSRQVIASAYLLRRCPFCGNSATMVTDNEALYWIECRHCQFVMQAHETEMATVEQWNTRSNEPVGLECPCGHVTLRERVEYVSVYGSDAAGNPVHESFKVPSAAGAA